MSYYPPYRSSGNNIKVELDLSKYATKDDVKKVNENERGLSFNRGFFYYLLKCDYVYECKFSSFDANINKKYLIGNQQVFLIILVVPI